MLTNTSLRDYTTLFLVFIWLNVNVIQRINDLSGFMCIYVDASSCICSMYIIGRLRTHWYGATFS